MSCRRLTTGSIFVAIGFVLSSAIGAPDSLPRDVGVAAILSPDYVLTAGDTVVPRAIVRNYGTEEARYFDVRFRIEPVYERTVVVPALAPGTGIEVRFEPWVAVPGEYSVACTTRLAGDEDPDNDRELITIRVLRPLALFIERDQADHIDIGDTRLYHFHAETRGDQGDSVRLLPVELPPGWQARYYDSTGSTPLPGTDRFDLGYLGPDSRRAFALSVSAPATLADTNLPTVHHLAIRGATVGDSMVRDSALLILTLEPGLQVHNYPNPFETSTTFVIGVPVDATVNLTVYDRTGALIRRLIVNEFHSGPAVLQPTWDGTNEQGQLVAPGTYQYLLLVARNDRTDRVQKRLVVTRD